MLSTMEISRSIGVGFGRAQAVGTAGIEGFGKRSIVGGVTQRNISTGKKTRCDTYSFRQVELIPQFGRQPDKLVEGDFANRFALLAPPVSKNAIDGVSQVTCFFDFTVEHGVDSTFGAVITIGKPIAD